MGDGVDSEQIRAQSRAMTDAGIPDEEATKITRMMTQNRFQQKNILRAQQTLLNAMKNGLPIEPIMNKAYEGMAKKKH